MTLTARILCIDGGGIRGLIPASILQNWESVLGPIAKKFHMIAGTSTGGILAAALTQGKSAEELVKFYQTDGPKIFSNTLGSIEALAGNVYDAEPLETALKAVLTGNLSDIHDIDLLVTAYELEARIPRLFKSWRARGFETTGEDAPNDDFSLVDVARATSAAPTYFPPAHILNKAHKAFTMVDGGVYANNPAMCACVAARRLYPKADEILVVSLGTGALIKPYTYDDALSWGIAGWAQPLLDIMFSGVADTTTYQLDQLAPEVQQFRFQTLLKGASESMDDVTPENLTALVRAASETRSNQSKQMSALFALLKEEMPHRLELGYPVMTIPAPKTFTKPKPSPTTMLEPKKKEVVTVTTPQKSQATGESIDPVPPSLGAASGALIGGAIGGPVGAVVGTIVGGVAGLIADRKPAEKKT